MGIWLFSQADQIVKSKVYDIKQQLKYYSPENIILMKKQEIEKLKAQIIENEEPQVKTKKRVAEHGEVFTAEREVNDMLGLVKKGGNYMPNN